MKRIAGSMVALLFLCSVVVCWAQQEASKPSDKPGNPASSDDGWHVDVTPYLWFAGVHGTAGVLGHDASIHASVSEVFDYLNLGFMGNVELRYKRLVIPVDFMWIKLTDQKALPFDKGATIAKAEFRQTIFTPGAGFRLIDAERFKTDVLFGIRYWHLNGSLTLQPSQLGISSTADWVDALGGAQIQAMLTPKVFVAVIADAGGASAKSDYEVVGLLGVRVAKKWALKAGYRYLAVNYRPGSSFVYDIAQSGIIVGATWSVK